MFFARTGTDSHMWSGKTVVQFFELMTRILRAKRRRLGLTANDRAMLLCDRCPSHSSQQYSDLREQWSREMNVLIVGTQ